LEFLVKQHPRRLRLKAFLMIFVPLMAGTLLVNWLLFNQKLTQEQAVLQATERHVIDIQSDILRYEIRMAISDLRFLSQELELEQSGSHFQLVEHVGESYAKFLRQKKLYDHLRFIDAKGIERIRIDYTDGKTKVVVGESTNRSGQSYFWDTIGLKSGQIYISPLELDVEEQKRNGQLMPTIRFATPVFNKNGKREGILVLNYDVNRLNSYLDLTHANAAGKFMLLNGDGYYLHHDDASKLWGFAAQGKASQSFAQDFPDAWTYIRSHSAGQIETYSGMFTFISHALGVSELTDYVGSGVSVVSHPEWYVVSWFPKSSMAAMRERLAEPYFEQYVLLLLLLVGVCWFFAVSRARRWISEEKIKVLSRAIDQAGESVVITDSAGVIEYVNPGFTQVTGYTAEEALGKTPGMLKSGKQSEEFYQNFWQTIMSGKVWSSAIVDRRKSGELYPAMMTVSPIKDDHGRITHYVGVQQDMSEYQLLEEKLRHAHKMEAVATLVGGIAHEFKYFGRLH
jgi:PAS domain S-box-containing protein